MNPTDKDYLIVVQCDIVKQRCPGYFCEKAYIVIDETSDNAIGTVGARE